MERGPVGRKQRHGQSGTDENIDQKRDGQQGKKRAADFQNTAGAPPTAALLIVEYGLARLHTFISSEPSVGTASMTNQPATQPRDGEDPIILAPRGGVTALYAHTFLAVIVGLALRLVFVHWFPTTTDDSATYLQLANNWIDHHVYGLSQNGQVVPTDLRTPGYPAFLAGVTLLVRRSIQAILLSQAVLDVFTCILTAALAAALAPAGARRRVWIIALWLAATCPFLANYSAFVLTEVVVTFLATAALACFAFGLRREPERLSLHIGSQWNQSVVFSLLGAFLTGAASLVRPEMPLLR